jgi:hypothetical protein
LFYQDLVPRDDPLWQLYLAVRNFTTPTGNELAEAFLSLPSRYRYTAPYPGLQITAEKNKNFWDQKLQFTYP